MTKDTTYLGKHAVLVSAKDFWEKCRPRTGMMGEKDLIDVKFEPLRAWAMTLILRSYNHYGS